MNLDKMLLVPVFALAGLATACSDDCVSSCEDGKECADAPANVKAMDCDKTCDDLDDIADPSGCGDKIDDFTSCEADVDDQCKDDTKCDPKSEAMISCLTTYCDAHAGDAKCTAVFADFGFTAAP